VLRPSAWRSSLGSRQNATQLTMGRRPHRHAPRTWRRSKSRWAWPTWTTGLTSTRSACVAYFLLTGTLVFQDDNTEMRAWRLKARAGKRPGKNPPSLRTELPIAPPPERIVMQMPREDAPADARTGGAPPRCSAQSWRPSACRNWTAEDSHSLVGKSSSGRRRRTLQRIGAAAATHYSTGRSQKI
jgi:hypothetical protein